LPLLVPVRRSLQFLGGFGRQPDRQAHRASLLRIRSRTADHA
jgi:hypothetical protein